jgi:hypothetical protein
MGRVKQLPDLTAILLGLWRQLRPIRCVSLRVSYSFRQHLAQLSLRRCPCDRCLPLGHNHHVGMLEGECNPAGD